MGKISIARDEPLKREVALKELLEAASANELCRRRFVDEAEITGQLEHPGVVPVHALGTDRQGRPFYVMRLVRGGTLKEVIDEYQRSPTVAALRALLRRFVMVCQTMAYAHNRGVIHRDLKPTNIMLGNFGETLVMDWGLAKPLAGGETPDSTVGDLAQALLPDRPDVTALVRLSVLRPICRRNRRREEPRRSARPGTSTVWGRFSTRSSPANRPIAARHRPR